MTINLSSGLTALSALSGSNSFAGFTDSTPAETRAVRAAKAQFRLAPTTPPWKQPGTKTPEATQIAAIRQMASIVDPSVSTPNAGSLDIQTAFTTYKALSKLSLLATAAARTTTTEAERTALQTTFAKGLADLQTYLGQAPADKVELSFGLPTRRAQTLAVTATDPTTVAPTGQLAARDAPIPGLTGSEVFTITLEKPGASDSVTVDLAKTVLPPTLDSVSAAINGAIQAIPLRNPDGSVVLDAEGNPSPRWLVRFLPDKTSGKWGMGVKAPNGAERVSVDQVGAPDALVVATGQTALDAPATTQILKFGDVADSLDRTLQTSIASVDSAAMARAKLTAVPPAKGARPTATTIVAATVTQAIATDARGFSYAVGTTSGDLQSNRSGGSNDLLLTKLDSAGGVVWQRSLGASGAAQGAAVSVSANGDVTVAGTVSGRFDGAITDGDMLVARYSAQGDERFATVVRALGADTASALAVGNDGAIYIGGKAATGGGDAFIARLDATGKLQERRTIDAGGSESVKALAIGSDGNLLALTNENGDARLRSISATAIDGTQATAMGAGRDGFVSRIDSGLSGASTSYIASAGDDQVDSVAFMNGALYVGGRTTGALDGAARGVVDGFVTRLDAATGALEDTSQFGQTATRTEPVRIAAASGGDTALDALGLHRGALNPEASVKLVAQTSLRAGDEFSLKVQGGTIKKVVIAADDTLATLGDRVRRLTGSKASVATTTVKGVTTLQIDAKAGSSVALIAGASGRDALAKLGIEPGRLAVPPITARNAPRVRPGGNFGLALTDALNVATATDAAASLTVLKSAISTTQTAYRSLYWDTGKAALANGSKSTALTPAQSAQLASYKAALDRLTPAADTSIGTFLRGF